MIEIWAKTRWFGLRQTILSRWAYISACIKMLAIGGQEITTVFIGLRNVLSLYTPPKSQLLFFDFLCFSVAYMVLSIYATYTID